MLERNTKLLCFLTLLVIMLDYCFLYECNTSVVVLIDCFHRACLNELKDLLFMCYFERQPLYTVVGSHKTVVSCAENHWIMFTLFLAVCFQTCNW